MQLSPEWIIAACAGVSLMITWTGSVAGGVVWLLRRLDNNKDEILAYMASKHEENRVRVDAMQQMLIRHDTILDPEYNGNGKTRAGRQ